MADCVFCRIARGELPSHRLLDNERVVAFLDRAPLTRGHALVIPRAHAAKLAELPEEDAAELAKAIQRLLPAVCGAVGAPAATVALHDGREAGQEVPHVHWHLVPRSGSDGGGPIHALFGKRPEPSDEQLRELAASVQQGLV